jgi:acyl dehydratase
VADGESGGPDKPGHDFPDDARARPLDRVVLPVDHDQTYRYAEASGDQMPIHLDDELAWQVGLPGIIIHGLCTMAFCSRAVIDQAADGDPSLLRRLAVRFAAYLLPGDELEVEMFDAGTTPEGRRAVAFEASAAGRTVIKNGWAEIEA